MASDPPSEMRSLVRGVRGFALVFTLAVCSLNLLVAFQIGHLEDLIYDNFGVGVRSSFSKLQNFLIVCALVLPGLAVLATFFVRSHRLVFGGLSAVAVIALLQICLVWVAMINPLLGPIGMRHTILNSLESATEVRIVEHSDPYDTRERSQYKERIYSSIVLDRKQKNELLMAFPFALGRTYMRNCVFVPHHRIEAVQPDGTIFTVELCFKCGEMGTKDHAHLVFPRGWHLSLKNFIASLGMTPDGPWANR